MFFYLLLAFVLVPIVEIWLLMRIGQAIDVGPTIGLILLTGTVGALLARSQGLGVLRRIRAESASGRLPADSLFDGLIILVAGAVLMTPGVLTDVFGFLCLVPAFRARLKDTLKRRFERAVREGRVRFTFPGGVPGDAAGPGGRVVDVDAKEVEGGDDGGRG